MIADLRYHSSAFICVDLRLSFLNVFVLHFRKQLTAPPVAADAAGISACASIAVPDDVPAWLALRDRAMADQTPAVRPWTEADFHRKCIANRGGGPIDRGSLVDGAASDETVCNGRRRDACFARRCDCYCSRRALAARRSSMAPPRHWAIADVAFGTGRVGRRLARSRNWKRTPAGRPRSRSINRSDTRCCAIARRADS